MTLSNLFFALLPMRRRSPDVAPDPVAASLAATQPNAVADEMDALEAQWRQYRQRSSSRSWLRRGSAALRNPHLTTYHTVYPTLPAQGLPLPPVADAERLAPANAARLAQILFGDDAHHRNIMAQQILASWRIDGEIPAFTERHFGMIKAMINRVWDTNNTHDTQRALCLAAFEDGVAEQILRNPALSASLHKFMLLHTAVVNAWSPRFLRAVVGPLSEPSQVETPMLLPECLGEAFSKLMEVKAEQQPTLQALLRQEMTASDWEALQPLCDTDLGRQFLTCCQRIVCHSAQCPDVLQRSVKNSKKVISTLMADDEVNLVMRARLMASSLRQNVRQALQNQAQQTSELTRSHEKSIAAFVHALRYAREQELLEPSDIDDMSQETFMALGGWTLLHAVQSVLAADIQKVALAHVDEEIFHSQKCRQSAQALLDCVNAVASQTERLLAVKTALHMLASTSEDDLSPAAADVLLAAKKVSSDVFSGDRPLFTQLCIQAYKVCGNDKQTPGTADYQA